MPWGLGDRALTGRWIPAGLWEIPKKGLPFLTPGAVFPLKEGLEASALPGRDSLPTVCSHTWAVSMETLEGLVPEEWGRGREGHVWPLQVCSPWAGRCPGQ